MKKHIKKIILLILIIGFGIFLQTHFTPLPNMSKELSPAFSATRLLPKDPRYDYAIVIYAYGETEDRNSINFSKVRQQIGERYTEEGSVFLVLIKNQKVVAFAEILERDIQLTKDQNLLFPAD